MTTLRTPCGVLGQSKAIPKNPGGVGRLQFSFKPFVMRPFPFSKCPDPGLRWCSVSTGPAFQRCQASMRLLLSVAALACFTCSGCSAGVPSLSHGCVKSAIGAGR